MPLRVRVCNVGVRAGLGVAVDCNGIGLRRGAPRVVPVLSLHGDGDDCSLSRRMEKHLVDREQQGHRRYRIQQGQRQRC